MYVFTPFAMPHWSGWLLMSSFALDLISMVTIVLWRVDPRRIVSNVVLHWKCGFQTRFFSYFLFVSLMKLESHRLYRYIFHHLECMVGLAWKDYMLKMNFSMEKMNGISSGTQLLRSIEQTQLKSCDLWVVDSGSKKPLAELTQ